MPGPRIESNIDCFICRAVKSAEPEVDGDYGHYECRECGSVFGFSKVTDTGLTCAAGLALDPAAASEPVPGRTFLGNIGIRERHNDDETP